MEINGHEEITGEEIDHACDTQSPEDRWIDKMNEERQKEFNLSEKEFHSLNGDKRAYYKENVKEFIRRLKEEWPDAEAVHKTIDKLAGPKLT